MNPHDDRNEPKTDLSSGEPRKKKRFLLVRLEERIAPRTGNDPSLQAYTQTCYCDGGSIRK
jgi:hypothetical protein